MDRLLRSILEETPGGRKYLADLDKAKRAKRARSSSRKPRAAGRTREERREERNERMAKIRAEVCRRARGKCEACDGPIGDDFHAHHVVSGGLRQARESVRTVAAICSDCHTRAHVNDFHTLCQLLSWAASWNYSEAFRAIEKRINKVKEARPARQAQKETAP